VSGPSVLEQARAMAAEVTRIKDNAESEREAQRVGNRLAEITVALNQLSQVTTAARQFGEKSGQQVNLSGLDGGREALARRAERDLLPKNPAFAAARTSIDNITKRVSEDLSAGWVQWTGATLREMRIARIPMLSAEDRKSAQDRLKSLQDLSKKNVPTSTDIVLFASDIDLLGGLLDTVPDPEGEIASLLKRLEQRPPLTLADLTDEQLALLRQPHMAGQIELRRRGA
jgi:hypothetical protein